MATDDNRRNIPGSRLLAKEICFVGKVCKSKKKAENDAALRVWEMYSGAETDKVKSGKGGTRQFESREDSGGTTTSTAAPGQRGKGSNSVSINGGKGAKGAAREAAGIDLKLIWN